MNTPPHCCFDSGLPLYSDDTRMLTNLRVVVMVVLVKAPKRLMVRKMKFCPTAPHRQNRRMSHAASGCRLQNPTASYPPPPGTTNMKSAMYIVPHRGEWSGVEEGPGGEGILCGVREAVQAKVEQAQSVTQRSVWTGDLAWLTRALHKQKNHSTIMFQASIATIHSRMKKCSEERGQGEACMHYFHGEERHATGHHEGPIALEMLQAQYARMGASVPGSPGHIFSTAAIIPHPSLLR